jgi:dTDP-4-dehydrorhamnose 3,5-epimerase
MANKQPHTTLECIPLTIPGCFELRPHIVADSRGYFVKTFPEKWFQEYGLDTHFVGDYYSYSKQRVLRGMHFQLPPFAPAKLVYCSQGEVMDVIPALRIGSPTYAKTIVINLSKAAANMVYLPLGTAHGFYVLNTDAVVMYKVTARYSAEHDTGIHWRSIPCAWPDLEPVVSKRDSLFPSLLEFKSPFLFSPAPTVLK